jgi:hypothetical protein
MPNRPAAASEAPGSTTELDVLLDRLGRLGALFHAFQTDQHGPDVLAAVRDFGGVADVVILFDELRAVAYRTTTTPDTDVFAPVLVFWSYVACPVWTLRALLTVSPPGHPDAPATLTPAPAGLGLPVDGRLPVRIRGRSWR